MLCRLNIGKRNERCVEMDKDVQLRPREAGSERKQLPGSRWLSELQCCSHYLMED